MQLLSDRQEVSKLMDEIGGESPLDIDRKSPGKGS